MEKNRRANVIVGSVGKVSTPNPSLTADRTDWLSLRWNVEPAGQGWFRVRSSWNGVDGYFTRSGNNVSLEQTGRPWSEQRWRIRQIVDS